MAGSAANGRHVSVFVVMRWGEGRGMLGMRDRGVERGIDFHGKTEEGRDLKVKNFSEIGG